MSIDTISRASEIPGYPHSDGLETLLAGHEQGQLGWAKPEQFDLSDPEHRAVVATRIKNGSITKTIDRVGSFANELFEIDNPDKQGDPILRAQYVADIKAQGAGYGKWFHFAEDGRLVRYLNQDDHRRVRTNRFRDLITAEEQHRQYEGTVVTLGLSVGSSVLGGCVSLGVGGRHIFGDKDTLSLTNLGRIPEGVEEVGNPKTARMARLMSAIDPYLTQEHLPNGFDESVVELLAAARPDVIVDAMDNGPLKARLRQVAREVGSALVMASDVGERSVIDIERHDLGDTKPFGGNLEWHEVDALAGGNLTAEQRRELPVKIVGAEHISPRMMDSYMRVGKDIAGIPQLGVTASTGGNLAAWAIRRIILGHDVRSGRYAFSPDALYGLAAEQPA